MTTLFKGVLTASERWSLQNCPIQEKMSEQQTPEKSSSSSSLYENATNDSDTAYKRVEKLYRKHHVVSKHGKTAGRFLMNQYRN